MSAAAERRISSFVDVVVRRCVVLVGSLPLLPQSSTTFPWRRCCWPCRHFRGTVGSGFLRYLERVLERVNCRGPCRRTQGPRTAQLTFSYLHVFLLEFRSFCTYARLFHRVSGLISVPPCCRAGGRESLSPGQTGSCRAKTRALTQGCRRAHIDTRRYISIMSMLCNPGLRPLASRCCRDEGGERAATKASIGRTPALPAIRSRRKRTVGGKNPPCPVPAPPAAVWKRAPVRGHRTPIADRVIAESRCAGRIAPGSAG